jgi:hypothetical protein
MLTATRPPKPPFTQAVRKALEGVKDDSTAEDLLFLEAWEIRPSPDLGTTLRASQIRRANPALTAEIHAELEVRRRAGGVS